MISAVPLGEICQITMGQAPLSSSYNDDGKGYALLAGAGDFGEILPVPNKYTTEPTRISKQNDIVLCIRATIGDANWSDVEYCLGRGVAGLRPISDKLDSNYLWHFIATHKTELKAKGTGSTFKQVSRSHIEEWDIPLPPLKEQKRIAAILDKADAIRRKRQQAIQLADEFLRSVFLEMFGDPVVNPKGWEVVPVGNIVDCIVPGRDKPKSFTGLTPWVTTNDLNHLGITKCSEDFKGLSNEEIKEVKAKVVPSGSVLMTCVGDLGIISLAVNDIVINQQLHSFLSNENMINTFLMYSLSFQKDYMNRMASNTTVPYMNKTVCNSIPIIRVPIKLQTKFDIIYQKVQQLFSSIIKESNETNSLINSLTQKAFSGQLN